MKKYQINIEWIEFRNNNQTMTYSYSFSTVAMLIKSNEQVIVKETHDNLEDAIRDAEYIANYLRGDKPSDLEYDANLYLDILEFTENGGVNTVETFEISEIRWQEGNLIINGQTA